MISVLQWKILFACTSKELEFKLIWQNDDIIMVCITMNRNHIHFRYGNAHFFWIPSLALNTALFEKSAVCNGVRNHSGHSEVHLINPAMHCNHVCTTDVHLTAREYL